jgi:hypothetical protein
MKTYQKLTLLAVVAWATAQTSPTARAESVPSDPLEAKATATAPAATNRHLKLCAMLGLKVGRTYEFMLSGNDQVHYWQVRSLGANGWILAKDARYPATWVNLSQVTAVTLIELKPTEALVRPKKPNRER